MALRLFRSDNGALLGRDAKRWISTSFYGVTSAVFRPMGSGCPQEAHLNRQSRQQGSIMTLATGLILLCVLFSVGGAAFTVIFLWWKARRENAGMLRSLSEVRISQRQYEKFAGGARLWMYSIAFIGGAASVKGAHSIEVACAALFLLMQVALYWVRSRTQRP